jgi:hypothetical protein
MERAMLDPDAQALLTLMAERGVPPVHTQTPAEARAAYRERRFYAQPDPAPMAEVRELSAGGVPARLYRPAAGTLPAILERPVIEKILTHLGLDPQPPPRGRAHEAGQD